MISVIIPLYNAEEYIARCLDSIITQTYSDLEIICIDDGSTDSSSQICKEYAKKDSRIHYHYIENGGVSNARNYALGLVSGEWFAFVDSDDWIEPDFYEVLLAGAMNNNCEISACQFQMNTVYKTGYSGSTKDIYVYRGFRECVHRYICNDNSLEGQVWNKIYKTEKFGDIRFNTNIKVNEDCLYTYDIVKRCERACVCNAQLYHWYIRKNSSCHKKNTIVNLDSANVFYDLYTRTRDLNDNEVSDTLRKNYVRTVIKILFDARVIRNDKEIIQALDNIKKFKKTVWKDFSLKERLKYYLVELKYYI